MTKRGMRQRREGMMKEKIRGGRSETEGNEKVEEEREEEENDTGERERRSKGSIEKGRDRKQGNVGGRGRC